MKNQNNLTLGRIGEKIASEYLIKNGFQILKRNFQKRYGEIDIVAREKECLVFIEVKTRKGDQFGPIEESITPWKLKSLKKSIHYYLHLYHPEYESIRADFLGIELTENEKIKKISYYKNIIY